MGYQVKNSFCEITRNKIICGAFHTFITAALIGGTEALFNFLLSVDLGNPLTTMLFVQVIGVAYNAFKEYRKGI